MRAVDGEPGGATKWAFRFLIWAGLLAGIALLVVSAISGDAPIWQWILGVVLVVATAPILVSVIRLKMLPEHEREAKLAAMRATQAGTQAIVDRGDLAYKATKYKKDVLRSGVDGTATINALAEGGRANEYRTLVYLELMVSVPGTEPYEVKTGEFITPVSAGSVAPGRELVVKVDPADGSRVAVDWDESLKVR